MGHQRIGFGRFGKAIERLRDLSPAKWVSVAAVSLAAFDTFIHPISLTALGLLALASLPWLILLIRSPDWPLRSIKFPGGVAFEFNELKELGEQAETAGLLRPAEHEHSFQAIFDRDPNLAMAGLRIELEKRLLTLAAAADVKPVEKNLGGLVIALRKADVLDLRETATFVNLVPKLNEAVHAQHLDERAYDWAMDVGPQLVAGLDDRIDALQVRYPADAAPGPP